MLSKINFKQPKYIFPAIVFIPVVGLTYCLMDLFGGSKEEAPTDFINTELPSAKVKPVKDKYEAMTSRFDKYGDENFTAIEGIELEMQKKEKLSSEYSDEELEKIVSEAQQKEAEKKQLEALQQQLLTSQNRLPQVESNAPKTQEEVLAEASRKRREYLRQAQADVDEAVNGPRRRQEEEEAKKLAEQQAAFQKQKEENAPQLVVKAAEANSAMFNTVSKDGLDPDESPLIRAMIDKTTKAHEGTRLRFKLLDDVMIKDVKLSKGTYLYGLVSGFGQQRVKATVSSVLVGNKFIKVNLSVFDNDGMEGFYVPSSAFRDFIKQAGGDVFGGNNMQFSNGSGYGNQLSGEYLALQALQSIYTAGSNALTNNIKKNKAKIKYNTVVYLINSQDAR